jgi:ABC-type nickel/cobalt efflux system permease component RcnA
MVPSVSAIILLLGSIAAGRPAYGIALTVAFGVGMAVVLVGIGVGLVHARALLERMPTRLPGRSLGRLVPAGSATVMLLAGVLITTQAALTLR